MTLPSTKVVHLPDFVNATFVARLARAVVMELQPLSRILEEFKIVQDQFEVIKHIGYYKRVSEEFAAEWNKITNTQDRLRLISAVMLEEGLPRLGSQMVDTNIAASVAVETGKFFAKIAGVGEGKVASDTPAGEKFSIVINLGEDTKLRFEKDAAPAQSIEDKEAVDVLPVPETEKDTE